MLFCYLFSDFLAAMAHSGENQSTFSLIGTDDAFGSRSKDVFAGLATIEAKHTAFESTPSARRESAALMKADPGEEEAPSAGGKEDSSFRAPIGPPRKKIRSSASNNVPGFQAEPSKWTMYDLSDVADSHMTEKSNRGAAIEFMLTRRSKAAADENDSEHSSDFTENSSVRHVFRKPARDVRDESATSGGCVLRQSSGRQKLRALAEEREDDDSSDENEDDAAGGRDDPSGQKNDCGVDGQKRDSGLAFGHVKGHRRGRCVRRRGSDSDEDGSGENTTALTRRNKAAAVVATEEDSDSDDFSELAAAGPENNDDDDDDDSEQLDRDQFYVSDMGVVSGVARSRMLNEDDDSNGDLDGVD